METMATIKYFPHFQRIGMLFLNLDPKASSLDQLYPFILKYCAHDKNMYN